MVKPKAKRGRPRLSTEPVEVMTFRIPASVAKALRAKADKLGVPLVRVVVAALGGRS
jgi:hypothetical protein